MSDIMSGSPIPWWKKNGKWRVCVDFTDINKAYPKDSYPLPHIDCLVEATASSSHSWMPLRVQSDHDGPIRAWENGFHHRSRYVLLQGDVIWLQERSCDLSTTHESYVFRATRENHGGLHWRYACKISRRTWIHHTSARMLQEIESAQYEIKPDQILVRCSIGEFLGYIVTYWGIDGNLKQINALIEMASQKNKREVQTLTGRVAAVSCFISRSSDKCLPFYKSNYN